MRSLGLAVAIAMVVAPALVEHASAAENIEYPALTPHYPFQRSFLTRRRVVVPPYAHPFRLRVFTTPQQPPYYNVPPYPVVTPY